MRNVMYRELYRESDDLFSKIDELKERDLILLKEAESMNKFINFNKYLKIRKERINIEIEIERLYEIYDDRVCMRLK